MLTAIIAITNVCDVAQNIRKSTEKLGEQEVLLAPPIILLGEHLLPLLPLFPRLWSHGPILPRFRDIAGFSAEKRATHPYFTRI